MADAQRSADGKLIDELAKSGSDLSKLHDVDFYLHFPGQEAADRASEKLVELALTLFVEDELVERVLSADVELLECVEGGDVDALAPVPGQPGIERRGRTRPLVGSRVRSPLDAGCRWA